jgi:hypothetical protein
LTLAEIIGSAAAVVSAICAALTFWQANRWRNSDEAKAITKSIADHGERLAVLENETKELATKGDIDALRAEIGGIESTMNAKIDGVAGQIKVVAGAVGRIEDYFLRKGVG